MGTDLALTADLGNSRLKLRIWRLGDDPRTARAQSGSVLAVLDGFDAAAREFARAHANVRAAALSSVAAPERERALIAALAGVLRGPFLTAPDCGLVLDVLEPAKVGRDRLYAARGALELVSLEQGAHDAIVLDAGTALTVDAVRATSPTSGTFLGGAIAPGPGLLARALAEHTARLPLVEAAAGAPALGRDTVSAVRAGVVVGFRGAARELALRVASEAGLRAPLAVVTGGAAGLLLEPTLFVDAAFGRVLHDPELVHRGLLAALLAALP